MNLSGHTTSDGCDLDFDKGTDPMHLDKLEQAAASFQKAVEIYPRYADAWVSLGIAQFRTGGNDARGSLLKAVELDPKLAGAWQELGFIASCEQKWHDAVGYVDHATELDPSNSALAWYLGALANYRLRRFDDAERSIRAEMKLDPQFQNRRARYLLGLILIARQDVRGGAEVLRTYLAASPDPRDVNDVKNILNRAQADDNSRPN